jgi:hypothetical protein
MQKAKLRMCIYANDLSESQILNKIEQYFIVGNCVGIIQVVKASTKAQQIVFDYAKNIEGLVADKNHLSRCIYHFLHKLEKIPTNKSGWPLAFKNIKEGYVYTEKCKKDRKLDLSTITDEKLIIAYIQSCEYDKIHRLLKYKNFIDVIQKHTGHMSESTDNACRIRYFKSSVNTPLYCKCCGNFIDHPQLSIDFCRRKCCRIGYEYIENDESKIIEKIKTSFFSNLFSRTVLMSKIKRLKMYRNLILDKTKFLDDANIKNTKILMAQ